MSEELKKHIEFFPSNFDTTSIAQQLVAANVPVMLYADVRDHLWGELIKLRMARNRVNGNMLAARDLLNKAADITMETW